MGSRFVRRVRTASGALAVQVVLKQGGQVLDVDHVGSAHSDDELASLLEVAASRLRPGQDALDLGELPARPARMQDTADFTAVVGDVAEDALLPELSGLPRAGSSGPPAPAHGPGSRSKASPGPVREPVSVTAQVVSTSAVVLWEVLVEAYARVGLEVLRDDAFRGMVTPE